MAVVGKPDAMAGELPVAFVVRKKDRKVSEKGMEKREREEEGRVLLLTLI